MSKHSSHLPQGDPCKKCGQSAGRHRVKHEYEPGCCGANEKNHKPSSGPRRRSIYAGIDGEGQGRSPHRYIMLCCADEFGTNQFSVENERGLGTAECLDFILELPYTLKLFAYSFNYDLTMILKDLPDEALYLLFRPELRRRANGFGLRAITWQGYKLNLMGTEFSVARIHKLGYKAKSRVIWDCWKFFRGKFVQSLKDWKVGRDLEFMAEMKEKRGEFDKVPRAKVREYCFEECMYMGQLVHKLVDAHDKAGFRLKRFDGAGSTASIMLDKLNIKKLRRDPPKSMQQAIACAFIGGRFEHSVVGPIYGPVYSFDISSAYPYELCFLPCLVHGRWTLTRDYKRMQRAKHACVRYSLKQAPKGIVWGPFPFRLQDGTIIFPAESGGGWVWRQEYIAAEKIFSHVKFESAWVLEGECDCQPFKRVPEFYLERVKLGKDAAGTPFKLGMNSIYGKLAQSSGSAPYQSWIWAGMVTSGTRAQILEFLALHRDPWNLLMVATDGIYTKEDVIPPRPRDTGTFSIAKPLGGWERKVLERGVFAARPGVYFPLDPTEDDRSDVKARGISKRLLFEYAPQVQAAWQNNQPTVRITNVVRFIGAKSATIRHQDATYHRTDSYGEWETREIQLSFDALPKRQETIAGNRMTIRYLPKEMRSAPYEKSMMSSDAILMRAEQMMADEQPDGGDYSLYEAFP